MGKAVSVCVSETAVKNYREQDLKERRLWENQVSLFLAVIGRILLGKLSTCTRSYELEDNKYLVTSAMVEMQCRELGMSIRILNRSTDAYAESV